jgi:hypothetical protein
MRRLITAVSAAVLAAGPAFGQQAAPEIAYPAELLDWRVQKLTLK